MRRALAGIAAALAVAGGGVLTLGGGSSGPHLSAKLKRTFTACLSSDCGAYAVQLNWSAINFPGTTGYTLFSNGTQVGTSTQSPFTFYGMDCGSTFTLGVQAHDSGSGTSQTYTTSYTTPACPTSGGPTNTQAPTFANDVGETTGSVAEGQTVQVSSVGTWSPSPVAQGATPAFTYQWQDCNATATSCSNIAGQNEGIYTYRGSDVGFYVRVQETATNAAGSTTASSGLVGPITSTGTTHYVAANGSDSNNGTSKATPWLHAPGMTGCTANCASYVGHAGDQFILRGGDVWDFTGADGTVGLPFNWGNAGSNTNRYYIGTDRSWFSGASWTRPVFDGDNPISGFNSGPASCNYDAFAGTSGHNVFATSSYTTLDDIEWRGICYPNYATSVACSSNSSCVVANTAGGTSEKFINWYFHGWSVSAGNPQYGQTLTGIEAFTGSDTKNEIAYDIFDGSDSTERTLTPAFGECSHVNHVYMLYVANMVCNNSLVVDDNVFDNFNENNSSGHGNTYEENSEAPGTGLFYNNVIRHIGTIATIGVNLWLCSATASVKQTNDFYNNVVYDVNGGASGNYLDFAYQSGCSTGGTYNTFNNTLQTGGSLGSDGPSVDANNHEITDSASAWGSTTRYGTVTTTTLKQANSTANGAGYTSTNQYAPTSGASPTVGAGTNETSQCGSLPGLCNGTTGAVGESSSNQIVWPMVYPAPRPSSGAWDVGAYQYTP